jgi:SET domain-containing protein
MEEEIETGKMKHYLPETWNDPRIEIKKSPISGSGMFAREPFKKGEPVCIVGGIVMTNFDFEAFQSRHSTYNAIQIDEDRHLVEQPQITQSLDGSMNHSCDSNIWMDDEVTLIARRDISAGEEITVDYALFTTQPNWMLDNPCHCGSLYCRHTISGNDWKLREVQERYRNHFSPFINRRIEKLMKDNIYAH